jgi:hypothetical protein
MNFTALLAKEVEAPWTPKLKDLCDISNFDDYADDPVQEYQPYRGDIEWCKDF